MPLPPKLKFAISDEAMGSCISVPAMGPSMAGTARDHLRSSSHFHRLPFKDRTPWNIAYAFLADK